MEMKLEDIYITPLEELRLIIDDWERVHIAKHGRIHCESNHCFSTYVKMKSYYIVRYGKERQCLSKVYKISNWRSVKMHLESDKNYEQCTLNQKIVGQLNRR